MYLCLMFISIDCESTDENITKCYIFSLCGHIGLTYGFKLPTRTCISKFRYMVPWVSHTAAFSFLQIYMGVEKDFINFPMKPY